jgi:hypothetical protein
MKKWLIFWIVLAGIYYLAINTVAERFILIQEKMNSRYEMIDK